MCVYLSVAAAFQFCLKYERRTEFRKLCEIVSVYSITTLPCVVNIILYLSVLYSSRTTCSRHRSISPRVTLCDSKIPTLSSFWWRSASSSWSVPSISTSGRFTHTHTHTHTKLSRRAGGLQGDRGDPQSSGAEWEDSSAGTAGQLLLSTGEGILDGQQQAVSRGGSPQAVCALEGAEEERDAG